MDWFSQQVYRVAATTGLLSTLAGAGAGSVGDGGPATAATLNLPVGIAFDTNGNLLIADTWNQRLRRVDARTGVIATIAGTGVFGSDGKDAPAASANLEVPKHVAVDSSGNIYFSEATWIRKIVAATGVLTKIAGTGDYGFSGDNGPATSAALFNPTGVAVDRAGNVYISDTFNNRVRRVSTNGIITTFAGNGNSGSSCDSGRATSVALANPGSLALDAAGNLYISDQGTGCIRKVTVSTGLITNSRQGLLDPSGISFDPLGNFFSLQRFGDILSVVTPSGVVRSVVRSAPSAYGYAGDNGLAAQAIFWFPESVAIDASGNIFIADTLNSRIRAIRGPLP